MNAPPSSPIGEPIAALIRGCLSAIPVAGGVITELGDLYLNPLAKRQAAWQTKIAEAVTTIEQKFSRLPTDLENDEAFVSCLYRVTYSAMASHQAEKLDLLRNSLVSAADPVNTLDDLKFQFIRYVDELSATHVTLLNALSARASEIASLSTLEEVHALYGAASGIAIDRTLFRSFVQDLEARFLLRMGDIDDFEEFATKKASLLLQTSSTRPMEVTELGRSFLAFVQN